MTKQVDLYGGRKKSISLFCSSHVQVFYIGYFTTAGLIIKELGHILELQIALIPYLYYTCTGFHDQEKERSNNGFPWNINR